MEKEEFFDMNELKLFQSEELYLSVDIYDNVNSYNTNILENKLVKLSKFPNTLEQVGKKYSCEKKIMKFISGEKKGSFEYKMKVKHEKNGVLELSVVLKNL